MEQDFASSFAALLGHLHHNPKVELIVSNFENEQLDRTQVKALDPEVEHLLSIVLSHSHYAVIHVMIKESVVEVMEGLFGESSADRWVNHVLCILKRRDLLPFDYHGGGTSLETVGNFQYRYRQHFKQIDGYNCLPIACATLTEFVTRLAGQSPFVATSYTGDQLRQLMVDKYASMIAKCKTVLKLRQTVNFYELEEEEETDDSFCFFLDAN